MYLGRGPKPGSETISEKAQYINNVTLYVKMRYPKIFNRFVIRLKFLLKQLRAWRARSFVSSYNRQEIFDGQNSGA